MQNFIQSGDVITVNAPANVVSGQIVVVGSLVGVAQKSAASGAPVAIVTTGVFSYAKVSALAIAAGDKLYLVAADNNLSKTASSNTLVGVAVAAAANPSATVEFKLGALTA